MHETFHNFLDSLKSENNSTLVEAIRNGYQAIYEALYDKAMIKRSGGYSDDSFLSYIYKNPSREEVKYVIEKNTVVQDQDPTSRRKPQMDSNVRFGITKDEDIYVWTNPEVLHPDVQYHIDTRFKWMYELDNGKLDTAHGNQPKMSETLIERLVATFGVSVEELTTIRSGSMFL
jgi:hypothetical protein